MEVIILKQLGGKETINTLLVKTPTITDFTPAAIKKAVLFETIQHPLTIYSAGISIVGLLYMALIDFNPMLFIFCFFTGILSLGSWIFNYFFRSHDFELRYLNRLQRALKKQTQTALLELKKQLLKYGTRQGSEQVDQLEIKFTNLQNLLKEKLNEGEITYSRYLAIARQVYFSGIDNLNNVLTALKSIIGIDSKYIDQRLEKLRSIREPQAAVLTEIKSLETRKQLRQDQIMKAKNLLSQNEAAMTQLDKTTIAIAGMKTTRGQADVDMETAMAELAEISGRARDYSIQ